MKEKTVLAVLVLTILFFAGCVTVQTRVSSVAHNEVNQNGSIYIMPGNDSIESQKIVKILRKKLEKKGYSNFVAYEKADVVIEFSAVMLGSRTKVGGIDIPNPSVPVYNPYSKATSHRSTGYHSIPYSTTLHQCEIRVQFQDGERLRSNQKNSILWEAVGKSEGTMSDIIAVAPAMIESVFNEIGKDADSKLFRLDINIDEGGFDRRE